VDRVEPGQEPERTRPGVRWLRLIVHFRLSIAVLVVSLAIAWWARVGILMWLVVEPAAWPWELSALYHSRIYLWADQPPYVLIVLSVAWLPVVPFLASDWWRMLRSRMNTRAIRLRPAFMLASAVVVLGAVLLLRQHIMYLFEVFGPPPDTQL